MVRITDDGTGRDLDTLQVDGLAVGPHETVWLTAQDAAETGVMFELGGRQAQKPALSSASRFRDDALAVAPDGKPWSIMPGSSVAHLDDIRWRQVDPPSGWRIRSARMMPDGSIRAVLMNGLQSVSAHMDAGSWTIDGAEATAPGQTSHFAHDAMGPDGTVWLGGHSEHGDPADGLARFDGTTWRLEEPLGQLNTFSAGPLAVGPDGTMWAYLVDFDAPDHEKRYLARYDGASWLTFTSTPGDCQMPYSACDAVFGAPEIVTIEGVWTGHLVVGPDGDAWLVAVGLGGLTDDPCPGLLRFDGQTWTTYLRDTCVSHIAFNADGSAVWATTFDHGAYPARSSGKKVNAIYRIEV